MVTAPRGRMTVEEFLHWDDGTDTRYELQEGRILAMAPPLVAHSEIVPRLTIAIGPKLSPPCRVMTEVGVLVPEDTYYVADLVVSCSPSEAGQHHAPKPKLIVEVLSPSTRQVDLGLKMQHYRELDSGEEIVFLDATRVSAFAYRRRGGEWTVEDTRAGAVLRFVSVNVEIPMDELYADIPLARVEPGNDG